MSITSHSATPIVRVVLSPRIYVQVESTSVVEANGWGETINSRIVNWLEDPWKVKLAAPTAAPPEKSESWLARTCRDHAAVLVITFAGTVLAGLFLVWLGVSEV